MGSVVLIKQALICRIYRTNGPTNLCRSVIPPTLSVVRVLLH